MKSFLKVGLVFLLYLMAWVYLPIVLVTLSVSWWTIVFLEMFIGGESVYTSRFLSNNVTVLLTVFSVGNLVLFGMGVIAFYIMAMG